jgi:hypothetical protein
VISSNSSAEQTGEDMPEVVAPAPRARPDASGHPGHPSRHRRPTLSTHTRPEDHPGRPRPARTTTVLRLHHSHQLNNAPERQARCSNTTPTHQNRVYIAQRPYSGDRVPIICGSPACRTWQIKTAAVPKGSAFRRVSTMRTTGCLPDERGRTLDRAVSNRPRLEDVVSGLSRNSEIPAEIRPRSDRTPPGHNQIDTSS